MANELMICMALETGKRFTAKQGYPDATGLIQFTDTAIADMNRIGYNGGNKITKEYLANLTAVQQLTYVKFYFDMWKTHYKKTINNSLDMYLTIWCPAATGKSDDYVCYSEEKDKQSKVRNYESNKSIEEEYYDEKELILENRLKKDKSLANGKIEKKDLKPRFRYWTVLGENNKVKSFTCQAVVKKGEESKKQNDSKWHDPVDNPMSTNLYQNGIFDNTSKIWGLFGNNIRKEVSRPHTGLDLFAKTGTNIYACVDGTVYNRRWHTGYGNTITIKVKDPKSFMTRINKDYTHKTTREIKKW